MVCGRNDTKTELMVIVNIGYCYDLMPSGNMAYLDSCVDPFLFHHIASLEGNVSHSDIY